MAIDNLNLYRQGLPAGHQTDKYSANPGFVFSKNADIFSSSNSFKATAWSGASQVEEGVVDVDPTGRFELHSNCRVWDKQEDRYVTGSGFNLGVIKDIYYNPNTQGEKSTGRPLRLFVKWDNTGTEWKTMVVVTTTIIYVYHSKSYKPEIQVTPIQGCKYENGVITVDGTPTKVIFDVSFDNPGYFWTGLKMTKKARTSGTAYGDITIDNVKVYQPSLVYNTNDNDKMDVKSVTVKTVSDTATSETPTVFSRDPAEWVLGDGITENDISIFDCYGYREGSTEKGCIRVTLNNVQEDSNSFNGTLEFEIPDDYNVQSYTVFLPNYFYRLAKQQGESYIIGNEYTALVYQFSPIYDLAEGDIVTYATDVRYMFEEQSELPRRSGEKFADIVVTDATIYRFGNKDGIGYITKASVDDPAGENAVTNTYPGIKFIGAVRYNDLIYIIADDRGISGLYAYNGSELVKIISSTELKLEDDLIVNNELFRFSIIDIWRDNILIGTDDGRVFMYGNTYGGKGLAVIFKGVNGESVEGFTLGNDSFTLKTKIINTRYLREYLGDKAIKNYQQEFEVVLPMMVGNHFIEKEIYDLHTSFILPSSNCSIEYWICANHYHFWTFTCTTDSDISEKDAQGNIIQYKADCLEGNYYFRFIERNGNQYTFELVGDLPIQTNTAKYIRATGISSLTFTSFNHFRKLISFSAEGYTEKFERITNINNKLDLPRTHSLQVMVKGYGTTNYTPEVFSINLVSNQRDRG